MKSKYKVIGLMSGTSLDGLDLACSTFTKLKSGWKYTIEKCTTVKYSDQWRDKLSTAHLLGGEELIALDSDFGTWLGKTTLDFMRRHTLSVDFISSHGHTVYHQPRRKFTYQIGNGYSLFSACRLPVVCDFRRQDVAFGGEGAPLVPAGDKFLFHEYDVCLNLGGIANLSVDVKGKRHAFDICFCNMGLNYLSSKISKPFDKGGSLSASGSVNETLLTTFKKIYRKYEKSRPSLGREIFENEIKPLLDDERIALADRLCTVTEAAAIEVSKAIQSFGRNAKVLCTGGGAFNAFLIARMLHYGGDDITFIIPDEEVIKFKEALVFGFLGVLRLRGETNCLKTVTKASSDSSSGTMIGFKTKRPVPN
jgi:anhydro-N-acetylmuramic acid kinase